MLSAAVVAVSLVHVCYTVTLIVSARLRAAVVACYCCSVAGVSNFHTVAQRGVRGVRGVRVPGAAGGDCKPVCAMSCRCTCLCADKQVDVAVCVCVCACVCLCVRLDSLAHGVVLQRLHAVF